jgi:hypothetical protein
MGKLNPRGKKTERLEAVAELEIGCVVEAYARRLSGVTRGEIPPGFRAQAQRDLIARGADTIPGLSDEANDRADEIRRERHED